jgi:hypothetical protein
VREGHDVRVTDEHADPRRPVPSWWSPFGSGPGKPSRGLAPRTIVLAIVTVVAVTALVVVLLVVRSGRYHTIHGALDVGTIQIDSGCRLAHRFQGIAKGTPVTITDASGAVVARSSLSFGRKIGPYCEFLFSAKVPDRATYRIEVDHRGRVTYTKAYFVFFRWNAGLALRTDTITWT